jgi:hypothetical protein
MFVQGFPRFRAEIFDQVCHRVAIPAFRKIPHVHRLMQSNRIGEPVQQRTNQRRSGARRSRDEHIAHGADYHVDFTGATTLPRGGKTEVLEGDRDCGQSLLADDCVTNHTDARSNPSGGSFAIFQCGSV